MKITFNKNWNNKLFCNVFTTIRRYKIDVGTKVDIEPKFSGIDPFTATCIACTPITYAQLLKKEYIMYQDTGVDTAEAFDKIVRAMYKDLQDDTVFYIILLKKIKVI